MNNTEFDYKISATYKKLGVCCAYLEMISENPVKAKEYADRAIAHMLVLDNECEELIKEIEN